MGISDERRQSLSLSGTRFRRKSSVSRSSKTSSDFEPIKRLQSRLQNITTTAYTSSAPSSSSPLEPPQFSTSASCIDLPPTQSCMASEFKSGPPVRRRLAIRPLRPPPFHSKNVHHTSSLAATQPLSSAFQKRMGDKPKTYLSKTHESDSMLGLK